MCSNSGQNIFTRYLWIPHITLGNTNGSRFEVYAVLGKTYGSGIPLRSLMVQANESTHAHDVYHWIDPKWLPLSQSADDVDLPAPQPLPQLKIVLNGVLQPISIPSKPRLIIHLPPCMPPGVTAPNSNVSVEVDTPPDETDIPEGLDSEAGDLLDQVNQELDRDATDEEDAPDWEFESDGKVSRDKDYIFCPAEHCKPLLRMFTRHFCLHPLFPERDNGKQPPTSDIICSSNIPARHRGTVLEDDHRAGRAKPITTYQRYFKSAWKKLRMALTSGKMCNCRTQKYNAHYICKHLVQAIPFPPIRFWREVIRRCALSLYRHPALIDKSNPVIEDSDDAYGGSITEGDNHLSRNTLPCSACTNYPTHLLDFEIPGGGIMVDDGSDEEVENLIGGLLKHANNLKCGADILHEQLKQPHTSKLWLKSFTSQGIGKDVSLLMDDINQAEKTGHVRKTTWAHAHDKNDAHHMLNRLIQISETLSRRDTSSYVLYLIQVSETL
ncbi:hypothetical protein OF83DRAFT_1087828 [Amylostereum chailletii]|nr:hypothetical protein OF83DRAFT_1087828 [Amylostereum chailletii]